MSLVELRRLAAEIRERIIQTTSKTGGHTAPNLGAVELTLALHRVFESPRDRIFWDVGHQCYAHKLVTGRQDRFDTLRQPGGIAGFPKRSESEHDQFDAGHSGNSISAALGAATGDRLRGADRRTVAVIGDGSIVAGMAFEALNHAGELRQDLVVVLNDNEMSIGRSTGAMAGYLNRIITGRMYNRMRADVWNLLGLMPSDMTDRARLAVKKLEEGLKNLVVPSVLFEELGFRYIGPVDGHDLGELVQTFRRVRDLRGPVLVHVVTTKGRGFQPAMDNPEVFHGIGPFDCETGERKSKAARTFSGTLGEALCDMAARDDRLVAITAGMCLGTGLAKLREMFPNRLYDVGICEQHAVTFAAGLALAGMRPVVAVYSTFLQRSVDQIIEDVCLQNLPVILAVDRAGLVGEDGPTHHGVFDLTYLAMIPRMTVLAPRDEDEMKAMLEFCRTFESGPTAVRYPRGGSGRQLGPGPPIELGRSETLRPGRDGTVLAVGAMVGPALDAAELLAGKGPDLSIVNARFVKPLDEAVIARAAKEHGRLATVEENVLVGGFGSAVAGLVDRLGLEVPVRRFGISDRFVEQGSRRQLLEGEGLSVERLADGLQKFFG